MDTGPEARLITSDDELRTLVARLRREPLVGADTEGASFHRYYDRVFLLQLSSRAETAIVDPLAVTDLGPFGELLADPAIEVVFHDADQDLRILARDHGYRARNLFDTKIAAQFLDEPGVGLAALIEKYFGITLDKRFQRADWSARPLTPELLRYAALDTRYLPALRDELRGQLHAAGRLGWAEEEFERAVEARWTATTDQESESLRRTAAKVREPRTLVVLRELFAWREALASRLDRAPFRVADNAHLLLIAEARPADTAALSRIPGVSPALLQRRGRELLAAVAKGVAVPDAELPRIERPKRPVADPTLSARIERLKAARNAAAKRLVLQPGLVCPNGTLEAIAVAAPQSLEDLARVDSLRRWQLAELGAALLAASK